MELMAIIRIVLRWWWLVLAPVVMAAVLILPNVLRGGTTTGGFSVTIRYSAAQTAANLPERDGDYQDVWLASELTVNALTDWVRTTSFKDEIALLLTEPASGFDPALLGVAADNRRSVGLITLAYPTAEGLQAASEAAITVLRERAQTYFPQLGGEPAAVTILDAPVVTAAPPPLPNRFAPLIQLGLALLAGILLAFLAEYLDPFVRRRSEIEGLGIPVVATLPKR
jgi:hypothetical protein